MERVRQGRRHDVQQPRRPTEVAAAYSDRFPRQDTSEATLEQHVHHTTDLVLNQSADRPTAKLIVVARLSRPVPRMVPQPRSPRPRPRSWSSRRQQARLRPPRRSRVDAAPARPAVIPDLLSNEPCKGLRRRVDTNFFVPALSRRKREREGQRGLTEYRGKPIAAARRRCEGSSGRLQNSPACHGR